MPESAVHCQSAARLDADGRRAVGARAEERVVDGRRVGQRAQPLSQAAAVERARAAGVGAAGVWHVTRW